jgi:serine/threonine protein kinase
MSGGTASIRVFGRYAVHDEIAAGGMATVHIGRLLGPVGFSRTVAIKRLHTQYARDPEFVAMFLDEARLAARISHPNVVPTLDVVASSDELLLVMEYVRGESLSRLLRAIPTRRVPPAMAVTIMVGVLHGLHAAHEAKSENGEPLGLVHRDVSPHNILVGTDGVPRVLDFGIAKASGRVQTTRDGQLKGKVAYMAPEQVSGSVTRVSDVYAAAVVLWEALAGTRLFAGANEVEVMRKVLDEEVLPPSKHVPDLPKELDAVTLRGLDRDPAKRFSTTRDMAVALENIIAPATTVRIGEWVESLAAQTLADRARCIARVERPDSVASSPAVSRAQDAETGVEHTPSPSIVTASSTARDKTMAYEIDGELAILVHSEQPPSDAEWGRYVVAIESGLRHAASPRCLVITDGDVVPTPTQRAVLNKLVERHNRPVPVAVMTHSRTARSIVTIMSWFNSAIRAFNMEELTEALEYLGLDADQRSNVLLRIMRMRIEVSTQASSTRASADLGRIAAQMESLMGKRLPALRDSVKKLA